MEVFDNAINTGYTIAWGSDVSEQGFTRDGIAVMPDAEKVQELSGSDMAHWLKMKPEEEMEQQLPPGISESGEVVDMAAYEAWQQENHPDIQQQMQRREEVNINVHRERGEDVEPGDDF